MDQEFKPTEKTTETVLPNEISRSTETTQSSTMLQPSVSPTAETMKQFGEPQPISTEVKSTMTTTKFKPAKKSKARMILMILIVLVLMAASAGAAYWWRDKTANDSAKKQTATIATLNAEVSALQQQAFANNTTINQTGCTTVLPVASVIDSIRSSITSGNTVALEGYMAPAVNVMPTSSGVIVTGTPQQAISSISDFINSATAPWDFALTTSVLNTYKAGGFAKYFPTGAIVGLSANNKVISFSFDCNAKISAVLLSPSKDLVE